MFRSDAARTSSTCRARCKERDASENRNSGPVKLYAHFHLAHSGAGTLLWGVQRPGSAALALAAEIGALDSSPKRSISCPKKSAPLQSFRLRILPVPEYMVSRPCGLPSLKVRPTRQAGPFLGPRRII